MNDILDQDHQGYTKELTREFFRNVYGYMFLALAISGGVAFYIGSSEELFTSIFMKPTGGISGLFYVVIFSPMLLSMLIQGGYRRFSISTLTGLFVIYSGLMGLMLSVIFMAFSMESIAITFFVSAGAFAGMAILGYTTKTDLTNFGSLLYMVFIGMFIAMIVNMFMHSEMLDYVVSFIGVFVFTGLTAFWMQKLKNASQDSMLDGVERKKMALVGGMTLYILFVNLFLTLLRFTGGSRD
jgi:FtsH-binding integral membrane protein